MKSLNDRFAGPVSMLVMIALVFFAGYGLSHAQETNVSKVVFFVG